MLVSLSTERSSPIRLFASRTNRSLRIEWRLYLIWLPLNHPYRQGLINILPFRVRTRVIQGQTYVCRCPRGGGMGVAHPTHVSCFEILLASFTYS